MNKIFFTILLLLAGFNLGCAKDDAVFIVHENGYVFCVKGSIVVERKQSKTFPAANQVYVPENWYFNPLTYSAQPFGYESGELYVGGLRLEKSKIFKVNNWFYRITAVEKNIL